MSELDLTNKFICMNGAMASGKTTQAKLLAHAANLELLLGEESAQPEIKSGEIFTQGSSLEVEKWFVNFHLGKLAANAALSSRGLVSDMSLQNDLIWGRALLKGAELNEFEQYYRCSEAKVSKPDIALLFLWSTSLLLRRVHERRLSDPNREFESNTEESFIARIQGSFIDSQDELGNEVHVLDFRHSPDLTINEVQTLVTEVVQISV